MEIRFLELPRVAKLFHVAACGDDVPERHIAKNRKW